MNITTLRKKARNGSLEVEHILQAAVENQPGLAQELARLAPAHNWVTQQPDGTRVDHFAKWAAVASTYAKEQFSGLRVLAQEQENISYIIGLIEEIHTNESISFLLELSKKYLSDLPKFEVEALRVAKAFNSLLSFKQPVTVTNSQAKAIQDFLFALYPHAKTEIKRAIVLLALRGIGDREAIKFVEFALDFDGSLATTKANVLRAVRKRLKANAGFKHDESKLGDDSLENLQVKQTPNKISVNEYTEVLSERVKPWWQFW
ncbi:hypothetical protein [Methylophilus sp. Leaf408]|uniref:hypothetical protein n=1 Tax=Methylophilus sp. Leaf408 TaxID=2876561 RepID=UPI001E30E049|nr:hypothetical protein [Methylophilus sp. Leaf408]